MPRLVTIPTRFSDSAANFSTASRTVTDASILRCTDGESSDKVVTR
jgi:hypothetical protein